MASCTTCQSPVRERARFCTRCGSPVVAPAVVPAQPPPPEPVPAAPVVTQPEPGVPAVAPLPITEPVTGRSKEPVATVEHVPSRIPVAAAPAALPLSGAAIGALAAGIAPLVISVMGNLVAAELARRAVGAVDAGSGEGAWAPVLLAIAVVFVLTAGSLTVCGFLGARALRETASGAARGRGIAIAGLATGGVNLVLWIAGLVVTVTSLSAVVI